MDFLDLIDREGPLSPSKLALLAGLHPATLTGILDRLERGGWIAREREQTDRRSVIVRILPDRAADVYRLYRGMNRAIDKICADYTEEELDLIAGFLQRSAD